MTSLASRSSFPEILSTLTALQFVTLPLNYAAERCSSIDLSEFAEPTLVLSLAPCRGLHDFLYSDEEDHGATARDGSVELFDGATLYQARRRRLYSS